MKKILIFGGTFNPVHNGHVRLCRLAADAIKADLALIIPTCSPVHKAVGKELVSGQDRINMCRLAFDRDNELVSDIEVSTGKPCYTYDTVDRLSKIYPDAQFYLVCGSDMFLSLHQWRRPDEIFKKAIICAMSRAEDIEILRDYADKHYNEGLRSVIIDAKPYEISSSQIRVMLTNNENVSDLIPSSVEEYIKRHGLYR